MDQANRLSGLDGIKRDDLRKEVEAAQYVKLIAASFARWHPRIAIDKNKVLPGPHFTPAEGSFTFGAGSLAMQQHGRVLGNTLEEE